MHLLLIEDNKRMARYLGRALTEEGHAVKTAHDGDRGLQLALNGDFDAVILDLMLPERSGLDLLEILREKKKTPVLVISARADTADRVKGLDVGADDYLTKPFAIEEFKARVRALLRRQGNQPVTELACANLRMDLMHRKVTRDGRNIELTAKEFAVLEYLMRNQGRVVPKTSMAEHVWGYSFDWRSNIIEVFINQLRNRIDRDFEPKLIHTVRGVGYCLRSS